MVREPIEQRGGHLGIAEHGRPFAEAVRRFRCDAVRCRKRIFAQRFADDVVAPLARRTGRLERWFITSASPIEVGPQPALHGG